MIIRTAKCSLKFANSGKLRKIALIIDEYERILKIFIERFWKLDKVGKFPPDYTVDSWVSARAKSAAANQAIGIVKGTRKKNDAKIFVIKRLIKEGNLKEANKLQEVLNKNPISAPVLTKFEVELDSRFCKLIESKTGEFDIWFILSSFGKRKEKVRIPLKKTKVFNKWTATGKWIPFINLNKKEITLFFATEEKITHGESIGIDIGLKKTFSTSTGVQTQANSHGHTLQTICEKLTRKKKGSKAFLRAQNHRKNYIRWSVNQLNLSGVSEIRLENIKNLRKGKATSALLPLYFRVGTTRTYSRRLT